MCCTGHWRRNACCGLQFCNSVENIVQYFEMKRGLFLRQRREWNIVEGIFQPFDVFPQSLECLRIVDNLRCTPLLDVYLRGSVVEEFRPHPGSDLDVYIFTDRNAGHDVYQVVRNALKDVRRPIEAIVQSRDRFMEDTVRVLLGTTRSYCVTGHPFPLVSVPVSVKTARALWTMYAPTRYSNGYPAIRSLIIAKQLFRAVGVVRLIEEGRLSRHLWTCLQWAWEIAPIQVAECYQRIWDNLQNPVWQSVDIKPVVRWLEAKEHVHQLKA